MAAEEPEAEFEPSVFEAQMSTITLRKKQITTLIVTTSTDVKYLEINGKTYKPVNSRLVKYGLSNTYTFVVTQNTKVGADVGFEIIAFDADDWNSKIYTVWG